jgi:hypothetical protein
LQPPRSRSRPGLRWTLTIGAILLLGLVSAGVAWHWHVDEPTVNIDAE